MGKKRSREQDGLSGGPSDKTADKMDEDSSDEEVSTKPHTRKICSVTD